MGQSNAYKFQNRVDYIADMVGGDVPRDLIKVALAASDAVMQTEQQTPIALEDTGGTQIDPATEGTLSSTLSREIATWSAGTLPVEQQTPVALEDTGGTQIDPATEGTLSSTLSREIATWSAGTLTVSQASAVDVADRDARNLGNVDVTDLPDSDYAEAWQATLSASTTNSYALSAQGAEHLDGRVKASGTHDVVVEWQDSAGNVIKTNTVASGVAGGTWTDLRDLAAITPYAVVKITDTSGADQTNTVTAHLR